MASVLGIPLPSIPIIAPNPVGQTEKASDVAVKDQKVHLSKLLQDTGWGPKDGQEQRIARGIVYCESSNNPKAGNACCIGLFAVNKEVWNGKHGIPADKDAAKAWLENPVNNAKAARGIREEVGSFHPWDTFNNGCYRAHMGNDPLIKIPKDAIGVANDAVSDAIGGNPIAVLAKLIKALFDPSTYFRLGKGWLGAMLLFAGAAAVVFKVANTAANSNVGKQAQKGVKVAAAAAAI